MKQRKLRVPMWASASSLEAQIGSPGLVNGYTRDYPVRSYTIPLRSIDEWEMIYVGINCHFYDDDKVEVEAMLSDIYHANIATAKKLLGHLVQVQNRIDKVLTNGPAYIPMGKFGDTLYQVFKSLGISEVVEYHGLCDPDVVRPLVPSDVAKYVEVGQRVINSIRRKAA